MIATAIAVGTVLALGLSLPVLIGWLLRVAGREERAREGEVARALARVVRSIAEPAPPDRAKNQDEARPRAQAAA